MASGASRSGRPDNAPYQHPTHRSTPASETLSFHGSINLIAPITEASQDWIDANIGEDAWFLCNALAVEPRYTGDIVRGMIDDGLAVYIGDGSLQGITS